MWSLLRKLLLNSCVHQTLVDLLWAPKEIVLKHMLSSGVCLIMLIICVALTLERSSTCKKEFSLLFKISIGNLIPKEESTDHISWDHKQFIFHLKNEDKINLSAYIFNYLCEEIKDNTKLRKNNVPYARLLSELFYRGRPIHDLKNLPDNGNMEKIYGNILFASVLDNIKLMKKIVVFASKIPLSVSCTNSNYLKDYPI